MEIIVHAHHATVPAATRRRAERAIDRLARRLRRPVDAVVCFEQEGWVRQVEIVLHAPRRRRLVATARSRDFGPALDQAAARLEAQVNRVKRAPRSRASAPAERA